MKNINYQDHPYWIPKCLNVGWISIPLQIFPYIYFPQIFTQIGCMIENVKIPIDHHTILVFWLFQNLLILSHLSESFDVPAGCNVLHNIMNGFDWLSYLDLFSKWGCFQGPRTLTLTPRCLQHIDIIQLIWWNLPSFPRYIAVFVLNI